MPLDPIIYCNETEEIFIVDIPTSIGRAQVLEADAAGCDLQLVSCPPITAPFSGTEPKSATARENVQNFTRDAAIHSSYLDLIAQASAILRNEFANGKYCHARFVDPSTLTESGKQRASQVGSEEATDTCASPKEEDLQVFLQRTSGGLDANWASTAAESLSLKTFHEPNFVYNDHEKTLVLKVKCCKNTEEVFRFRIPASSAFLLSNCQEAAKFRQAARLYSPESQGRFDFILLDPPWPNRSARRKSCYRTSYHTGSIRRLLTRMDLDACILPNGFIAIWVTNKPACRDVVLGEGGMFDSWNATLVEEWIWVKVTPSGETIMPLESSWRKPYEVLLIGKTPPTRLEPAQPAGIVKRRLIYAVPDLHSRKPCVKQLIERILFPDRKSYIALEVFGRYLVEGWFSWGNEVLKYNWQHYWAKYPVESNTR